ncbi:MAG: DUF4418 family protein [Treponema sp.]
MRITKILNIIIAIFSIVLSLTPFIIAPVCPVMNNGMHMACHYSGILVVCIGIAIAIIAIILLFIKHKYVSVGLYACITCISLAVHLITHRIIKIPFGVNKEGMKRFFGYCGKDTMACIQHHTFTITSALLIIIAVLSLVSALYLLIKNSAGERK